MYYYYFIIIILTYTRSIKGSRGAEVAQDKTKYGNVLSTYTYH